MLEVTLLKVNYTLFSQFSMLPTKHKHWLEAQPN